MSKLVVVIPTVRPECHAAFVKAWAPLFEKHNATLVTVWDGDEPGIVVTHANKYGGEGLGNVLTTEPFKSNRDLFCRRTDACRNLGFVVAAQLNPDYVLTLDDDVVPCTGKDVCGHDFAQGEWFDPIQAHIDALNRRVPLSWMNTAHDTDLYLRGVPYGVRNEAPVMLSHGVWVGTPDFDGETQLRLETQNRGKFDELIVGVPYSLPYYVGPVPRGVLFPLCGMNVMVRREALPYLYYAPQGPDSDVPTLHRFADIFMGLSVSELFADKGWACVTGYSTVLHTRASDAKKNFEQEKLGRKWMELVHPQQGGGWGIDNRKDATGAAYFESYMSKRTRYAALVESILGGGKV